MNMNRIVRVRVELQSIRPKIWRRIDIPQSMTLSDLHVAVQLAMGWEFSHLWDFEIDDVHYTDAMFEYLGAEDDLNIRCIANRMRLEHLIMQGVTRFVYNYDYGDDWNHHVILEDVRNGTPDERYPVLVDGERSCPPEDVGGLHGYMDFVEAVLNPFHREHSECHEWHGGPFHPANFDRSRIGEKLIYKGPMLP